MNEVAQISDRPTSVLTQFKRELEVMATQLPPSRDIPIEKMKSAIMVAVQKNPTLLSADRSTLWQSARSCAADGLIPDGREAAFVVFKTKINGNFVDAVQYIPMVFGLRKRAMNSGDVRDIDAYIVYEGEWNAGRFKLRAGDNPGIEHDPIVDGAPGEPVRGEKIGAYAIAVLKDGTKVRQWMGAADIEKRRRAAPSQKIYEKGKPPRVSEEPIGVWKDWDEEQWLKTLIRSISKKLTLSSEDQRAIQDSEHEKFAPRDVTPQDEPPAPRRNLAQRLAQQEVLPPDTEAQEPLNDGDVPMIDGQPFDLSAAFPGAAEWDDGVRAFQSGQGWTDCPHGDDREKAINWFGGWMGAKDAAEGGE